VSRRAALALTLCTLLLAGCFTGKRPYFSDTETFPPGSSSGDPAIDAVLARLDNPTTGPATAAYNVLTKYGNTTTPALLALSPGKRSITVGNTRFIQTETTAVTCTEDRSIPCVDGFDPQRISDTLVTVDFYAADTAKRLRRDASAKLGPAVGHEDVIAGQQATCVDVPVVGGTAVYCAVASGLLAKLDDGDVAITLTLYGDSVDAAAFTPPA
jgi:FlaG/FlaF family flagellin (archaellin)